MYIIRLAFIIRTYAAKVHQLTPILELGISELSSASITTIRHPYDPYVDLSLYPSEGQIKIISSPTNQIKRPYCFWVLCDTNLSQLLIGQQYLQPDNRTR